MEKSHRFEFDTISSLQFWGDSIAEKVIERSPDKEMYTCAAGISPSGIVHFGNFRDIITSYAVASALKRKGKNVRMIFSWDNFDRLRKIPLGVEASFAEHIGKPLSKIPDPFGTNMSYAEHFQKPFEEAMKELNIPLIYLNQTELHEAGTYDEAIFHALKHRKEIADILLSFMTEKGKEEKNIVPEEYRESYYPIAVYSRFSGKDNTTVLSYDGVSTITYLCHDTKKEDTVDLSEHHIVKLGWKPDWAMRWKHEDVDFEPAGHDHASPGGSYDTSSVIIEKIFNGEAPVFAEYKFVGIQGLGAKMSGSKGNAISPQELLEIYDPILLKWMYLRKLPSQSFMLAFDTEIYRQYDEFDKEALIYTETDTADALHTIFKDAVGEGNLSPHPIPFRQMVAYGQIVQWDRKKLNELLSALHLSYDEASIDVRLPRAKAWLMTYNPEEQIVMRESINIEYKNTLDEETIKDIQNLRTALIEGKQNTIEELELLSYSIPKKEGLEESELKKKQRAFFGHIYNLLIGKDTGPRLGTFLWAIDRDRVIALLDI